VTKRKSYDKEFKLEAVQLVESGKWAAEVSRELNLAEQTLHNWVKKFGKTEKLLLLVVEIQNLKTRKIKNHKKEYVT
jgi:transposase-like protein